MFRKYRKALRLVSVAVGVTLVAAACGTSGNASGASDAKSGGTIRILTNFGSAFYPFIVAKEENLIQKYAPGVTVQWVTLSAGADSVTALASGQEDIASLGVPPLLIAVSKQVPIKLAGGLVAQPAQVVAINKKFKTLKDFGPSDRIAVPGTTSFEATVLQVAAQAQLGNFHALDKNMIVMPHPDGVNALKSGQIAAQFTQAPYLQQDIANGGHVVLDGDTALGTTFSTACFAATQSFYNKSPKLYDAVIKALAYADNQLATDPAAAARALMKDPGNTFTQAQLMQQITEWGADYTLKVLGYQQFATAMKMAGEIPTVPTLSSVSFPNVTGG
jgi:NitT/TauT family transport system substrate-binding protein